MNPDAVLDIAALDAVIFDMDGVVTRTADLHAQAWKQLFDEYLAARKGPGEPPFDADQDYRRYVDGKPRADGVASFLESRGISLPRGEPDDPPDSETVWGLGNRKDGYFWKILDEQGVRAYESTVDLIKELKRRGRKVAIFSASKNADPVLKAAGVRDLFDAKVDGLDAQELGIPGKPDPATLLEAARRISVAPERAAIVEDAIAGVQAGRAGGFAVVVGVNRGSSPGVLLENGAGIEVTDLGELGLGDGEDLPSALESAPEILERMRGKRLAVFLDYDGTLTPIVERPELAMLPDDMRRTLEKLAKLCPVGILSGRDLDDVRGHVEIESVYYAGSHGFDLLSPDGKRTEYERAAEFLPALEEAERELELEIGQFAGAWAERKRFAIAVHHRQARDEDVPAIEKLVDGVAAAHPELYRAGGKKIFELRPRIEWHKGTALLMLLQELGLDGDDVLPIYIGDDVTDEDAFEALSGRGIGIIVRDDPGPTAASYELRDTDEVRRFLDILAERLAEETR